MHIQDVSRVTTLPAGRVRRVSKMLKVGSGRVGSRLLNLFAGRVGSSQHTSKILRVELGQLTRPDPAKPDP